MKILDLFCGAGGSAKGFNLAGVISIRGVDNRYQKRYPYDFTQGDALDYLIRHGHEFDLINASPPCQPYLKRLAPLVKKKYPRLIEPIREILKELKKPYIIECPEKYPLDNPLMLCGSMFGLRVIRHRYFETYPLIWFPPYICNHWGKGAGTYVYQNGKRANASFETSDFLSIAGRGYKLKDGRIAMGIDWMTVDELSQAIPPLYTKYIVESMMKKL
jgi:DNA (cytosine-5)-methyltransferase 1